MSTSAAQTLGERLPFEQLHHQVVGAFVLPDVVEYADVRVIHRRDGARLALESLGGLRPIRDVGWQHLDRDCAVQPRVFRAIDLSHAACAKRFQDFVRSEPLSAFQGHDG